MSNIPEWLIEGIREEEAKWKATEESSSAAKLLDERIGQQFPSDTIFSISERSFYIDSPRRCTSLTPREITLMIKYAHSTDTSRDWSILPYI